MRMTPRDPLIITGAPRSGVRLLAAILDSHPALASGPDLPILVTLLQQWREFRRSLRDNHERHFKLSSEHVQGAFREAFAGMVGPRLAAVGKRRFVVNSFASTVCLDAWSTVFPGCRMILVVRNPRDVVASLLGCRWLDPRSGGPLRCTVDALAAARLWADSTTIALQTGSAAARAGRLMLLRYEDLCRAPTEALNRVAGFIGEVAFDPVVSASSAELVSQSLDYPHPPLRLGPVAARTGLRLPAGALGRRIAPTVAPLAARLGYQ
jgi:hypothetical protein